MKRKHYSLFLLLLVVLPLYAQSDKAETYLLKGQVIDSLTNETVPYATLNIALTSNPGKAVKLMATDENGKFTTSLAAPGDYVMLVQSVGKATLRKTFTIAENKKILDLGEVLISDADQRLGEVTVVAQKPLVKVDIDKITYSLEDDPEAQTNNTLEMLRKVPMVTVDGEDKIQLKGSENFKIYLNGKPSNMLSSNNASDVLKSMPASSVKNIEVITDPGAKYDAEGVGGIINITTTKNALQGYTATLNAEATALGRYRGGGYVTTKIGKVGLTGNYNYMKNNSPWTDYSSFRQTKGEKPTVETENGRNKGSGPYQFGSFEFSYEIDTLNLLSVGANLWKGKFRNKSEVGVLMTTEDEKLIPYSYDRNSNSSNTFGSIDMNVDYQRSTSKKDELFTVSYRFSNSPNDSESKTFLSNEVNYPLAYQFPKWNVNDAYTNEHTGQLDYTTPLFKDHTLETGLKYILRQSNSNTIERIYADSTGWQEHFREMNDFKHTQHIYSAYFAYAIKYKSYGFKAGVRAEGTALDVKYADKPDANFNTDFFNIVPNATISYSINMTQQVRLGYNMRIYRPGIWHLNPYINDVNPNNISYGNPNLSAEKSHGINLNYSMFTPKFNVNANVSYRFVNNSIERYTFVNEATGGYENTYYNMGKNQNIGVFLYGRWSPVKLFNISLNGGLDYTDINGTMGLSNNGWSGRVFATGQVNLPKDFNVMLNGGYFSPWIQLQSKGSGSHFHAITLNKSFLDKKLTIGLSANSPFKKNMKFTNTMDQAAFYQESISHYRARDFRIRISYRFGTLKDSIKKVRRGISNDDQKSGGGNEGGGGAQQGG